MSFLVNLTDEFIQLFYYLLFDTATTECEVLFYWVVVMSELFCFVWEWWSCTEKWFFCATYPLTRLTRLIERILQCWGGIRGNVLGHLSTFEILACHFGLSFDQPRLFLYGLNVTDIREIFFDASFLLGFNPFMNTFGFVLYWFRCRLIDGRMSTFSPFMLMFIL